MLDRRKKEATLLMNREPGLLPFLKGLWLHPARSAVGNPAEQLLPDTAIPQPNSVLIIYILHLSRPFLFF